MLQALGRENGKPTVLVVRLGAMGDILRTLPPVRLLRRHLPEARIFWVADDRWGQLLEGQPDLDGTIELPRSELRALSRSPASWPGFLRCLGGLRRRLREIEADLVIDFHGNLRSGFVGWLSGAPVRLGHAGHQQKECNRWFTTHRVPSGSRRSSRVERNLDLLRALGVPVDTLPAVDLPLADAGEMRAREILSDVTTAFAILTPGSSAAQAYKKPPAALLGAAARRLSERGVPTIVVYGPGELPEAQAVTRNAGSGVTLAPPTDLPTLAALLRRARMFVGGDTGPLHMACAVGCPVLGIYGPTDPEVNRPWGVPFVTVFPPAARYHGIKRLDRQVGFEGLGADAVEAAVDRLFDETS